MYTFTQLSTHADVHSSASNFILYLVIIAKMNGNNNHTGIQQTADGTLKTQRHKCICNDMREKPTNKINAATP